jgi:uncharacterized PurR-regulated membrane protein YhhQ (DUF165 family)
MDFRIVFNKVNKMRKNNTPEIVEYPQMIDSSSRKRQYINPEEPVTPVEPRNFISYPYMIAIMSVLQVLAVMYGRKMIVFCGFNVAAGGLLLMPLVLYILQIVAECYGWQYARQMIWCNFLVNSTVVVITFILKFIPFSSLNHAGLQNAYSTLMDTMWVSALIWWISVFFANVTISVLTCWSRFNWNGRFVIIRAIMLHFSSEIILLSGFFITMPYNGYSVTETINFVKSAFIARTVVSMILLPFARCIIWYIQHQIERVVVFDYKQDFSPFKFAVNLHDAIQFDTKEWSIMPNTLKKNFNFARAMTIYQSSNANCRFTVK